MTKNSDNGEFFSFVLKQNNDVATLLVDYINFHGLLNFGHMGVILDHINKLMAGDFGEAGLLDRGDVFSSGGEIKASFLEQFAPSVKGQYFDKAQPDAFERFRVFEETPNQYMSNELPSFCRHRLHLAVRPALDIYKATGNQLFVTPYGHQYFNAERSLSWAQASTRSYSKSILKYQRLSVDRPMVIIQDQFEGNNLCHFLYDYVPRIVYFVRHFPDVAKQALFVMGGEKANFHTYILGLISRKYNIKYENFIFPSGRNIWELSNDIYFFSDQALISHPLHMCAPETMDIVQGLVDAKHLETEFPKKIYISRQDASMRRIVNEDVLFGRIKKLGFCRVLLSRLSAVEQISMLANAKEILGPHGMGMTNIIFNSRRGRLVELFSPIIGSDAYAFVAKAVGFNYGLIVGEAIGGDQLDYQVNISAVTETLESMPQ
jgi:hypothetical protein